MTRVKALNYNHEHSKDQFVKLWRSWCVKISGKICNFMLLDYFAYIISSWFTNLFPGSEAAEPARWLSRYNVVIVELIWKEFTNCCSTAINFINCIQDTWFTQLILFHFVQGRQLLWLLFASLHTIPFWKGVYWKAKNWLQALLTLVAACILWIYWYDTLTKIY